MTHPFTPEEIIILASWEEAVRDKKLDNILPTLIQPNSYFSHMFIWNRSEQGWGFWAEQERRFQKNNYKIARR